MARVLIAGCGYVGTALGALLADDGHEVFALRRSVRDLPAGAGQLTVVARALLVLQRTAAR